ncbi:MAG: endonuclease III [Clostridia bacterium]|nr:endonuclease III [Clostridia bacterium]
MDAKIVMDALDVMVENPRCELEHRTPFELLIAVILSAQCTDKRVNQVTQELFKTHNTPKDFVEMSQEELEAKIHSCGFFRNKAKSIKSASWDILQRFGGEVPSNFDDLTTLAGVGRKTANVVMAVAFGGDNFAVDTHVLRVSNRLELVKTTDPNKCEFELCKIFPKNTWSKLHYQMVLFGRYTCKAMKPECEKCVFNRSCPSSRV